MDASCNAKAAVVAVVGPTATGKTALGVALAQQFSGEVISADSMQIYKGLDVGTAKVTPQETCGIPHHGVDILTPEKTFSVADFTVLAGEYIQDITARGHLPLLVGGTGLYVQSLLYGVRFTAEKAPDGLREQLTAELEAIGPEAMYAKLQAVDPEAAAAADQWVKEHPEEWKELEHMLYYSEANFHKRVAPDTLEDLDIKQPRSYNPEAFLPEEVRNAIYNDRRWFDRSKYLPEGSDEDPFMYLDTQIYDALHALTELQREILFRTIINGESTESVAQDKQCSSRNIRDIRVRALRQIRAKIKRREGYGRPDVVIIILLFMLLVGVPLACWGEQLWAAYPWLESVAAVLSALVMAVMFQNSLRREAERLLRQHWASLNGSQKKA